MRIPHPNRESLTRFANRHKRCLSCVTLGGWWRNGGARGGEGVGGGVWVGWSVVVVEWGGMGLGWGLTATISASVMG